MKKLLKSIALFICFSLGLSSCQQTEIPTALNIKNTSFEFSNTGGTQTLSFVANKGWKISASESWCKLSQTSGSLTDNTPVVVNVICEKNETYSERTCDIVVVCSELSEFITVKQHSESIIDLSADGTANCYIVPRTGVYKFKATKGNSSTTVSGEKAIVLWRSYQTYQRPSSNNIVVGTRFEDGYIYFSTSEQYEIGNAVIALISSDNTVQWSWHLWFTDADLGTLKQTYARNAGILMDRNLGSLSNKHNDPLTIGLMYEWGRKDPFMGVASFTNTALAQTDIKWPDPIPTSSAANYTTNAIQYSIEHPTTYIYNSSNTCDWQSITLGKCDTRLWDSQKTIYDPCPAGWRVPDGGPNGLWAKAGIPTASTFSNHGITISTTYCNTEAWYPSYGGGRQWNDGNIHHTGEWGACWSCTYLAPIFDNQSWNFYCDFDYYSGEIRASSNSYSGQGQAVRCCKE